VKPKDGSRRLNQKICYAGSRSVDFAEWGMKQMINEGTQSFVAKHGEWTAMAIKPPEGRYTREPAAD